MPYTRRDHPLVAMVQQAFGWTDAQPIVCPIANGGTIKGSPPVNALNVEPKTVGCPL